MSIPRSRVLDLLKVQCHIFNTTFNPTQQRLGNKILRQRLKGPALSQYYPPRIDPIAELRKAFPQWHVNDEAEEERVAKLAYLRSRGKGAPKKRTAAESKKLTKRRK